MTKSPAQLQAEIVALRAVIDKMRRGLAEVRPMIAQLRALGVEASDAYARHRAVSLAVLVETDPVRRLDFNRHPDTVLLHLREAAQSALALDKIKP